MKLAKYIAIILLIILTGWLSTLPVHVPAQLTFEVEMPDFDFRTAAQELWQAGEKEEALTLLDSALSFNTPDKVALKELSNDYHKQLKETQSGLGKLKAFGYAFATGKVNSFEELAGSSVADFFIYGDIRDLSRELIFENHADPFIASLSAVGLLTSVFPPADATASILKSAKKSDALSSSLQTQLTKAFEPATKSLSKTSTHELKGIITYLQPIYQLGKNSKTWKQFTLYLKHCENIKQVKFINKVLIKPENAQKLSSILILLNKFPQRSKEALSYIRNFGQKGMDALYAACRKGPKSLQFLLKNPGRVFKLSKNAVKSNHVIYSKLEEKWQKFKRANNLIAELSRLGVIVLLILITGLLLRGKKQKEDKAASYSKLNTILSLTGLILVVLFVNQGSGSTAQVPLDSEYVNSNNSAHFSPSSIILLTVFAAAQLWAFMKVKSELKEISSESRLLIKNKMLENAEFFFDLPIYLGLSGTVFSFMLLTFDPSGSRIIAYGTTITGILLSIYMRGFLLMPLKKQLVKESE